MPHTLILSASHHARAAYQSLQLLAETEPLMAEPCRLAMITMAEAIEALDASDTQAQIQSFAAFMEAGGGRS